MKNVTAIININTGSNITTCIHTMIENERGKVISIEVSCDNVDDYPYHNKIINSNDVLKKVFKGFNDTFSGNNSNVF